MNTQDARKMLREIAIEYAEKGPGYAQESVVLRNAMERIRPVTLRDQQMLLEFWQELFEDGTLSWGYDLDNPSRPFYHRMVLHPVTSGEYGSN